MKNILQIFKILMLVIVLSVGMSYVYAWTAPTVTPPGGNVAAPINTSSVDQTKAGSFTAANLITGGSVTGANRASIAPVTTGVYDDVTSNAPYSQINSDSFHTNGLGVGQIFIEGNAIDANSGINIGKGLAGGQAAQPVNVGSLNATGISLPAGATVTGGGSVTTYGATTIQGSKGGWAGANFQTSTANAGTLMMHPSYSGFYNAADNAWRWYVTDAGSSIQPGGITAGGNVTGTGGLTTGLSVSEGTTCSGTGTIAKDIAGTGKILTCQSGFWRFSSAAGVTGGVANTQVLFRTNSTWTAPAGVSEVFVILVAGGGGGAGIDYWVPSNQSIGRDGGNSTAFGVTVYGGKGGRNTYASPAGAGGAGGLGGIGGGNGGAGGNALPYTNGSPSAGTLTALGGAAGAAGGGGGGVCPSQILATGICAAGFSNGISIRDGGGGAGTAADSVGCDGSSYPSGAGGGGWGAGAGGWNEFSSGGGGGGGYAVFKTPVTPGQVYTITVGQGGASYSSTGTCGGMNSTSYGAAGAAFLSYWK